jgi:hypothetical protein
MEEEEVVAAAAVTAAMDSDLVMARRYEQEKVVVMGSEAVGAAHQDKREDGVSPVAAAARITVTAA